MASESGQGCRTGQGCGTDSCSSDGPCGGNEGILTQLKPGVCSKCKEELIADGPLCCSCLHMGLLSKFKTAANKNSMVTPEDRVLVAFSGGPASRIALEFLRELRSKAQTDMDASRDQGQPVFGLGVVFVNETIVSPGTSPNDAEYNIEQISTIVLSESENPLFLHIANLEDVFDDENLRTSAGLDEDVETRRSEERLEELLGSIEDVTGREDLVTYLRMQVLQKVAKEHRYTKLALGLCTSRIAARSIAATAKGQGYSFPAEMQYVDTRWPVPVVLPLRDCLAWELDVYCRLANLKTASIKSTLCIGDKSKSINTLSQVFVSMLQEQNPSREYTITRTIGKLKPFKFNRPPATPVEIAVRRRERLRGGPESPKTNAAFADSTLPDIFCPICNAPLDDRDFFSGGAESAVILENCGNYSPTRSRLDLQENDDSEFQETSVEQGHDTRIYSSLPNIFKSMCCLSCKFQILPNNVPKTQKMYDVLPAAVRERAIANLTDRRNWMRSRIEANLLGDD